MSQTNLDFDVLRGKLASHLVGGRIFHYDSLDSTMDQTRHLAEQGVPEGAIVVAEEQKLGRGRFGRTWISPKSQNLSFSVLLRPTQSELPFINMAATLAIFKAISDFPELVVTIKWPNDVYVNGRKISGVLIETKTESPGTLQVILGIGVNVNFDPSMYPEIRSTSTSICKEVGYVVDRTNVFVKLVKYLDDYYSSVKDGASLTEDWASKLETLGRDVEVRWGDQILDGRADCVDKHGNLVLKRPDGSRVMVPAGEVTLKV